MRLRILRIASVLMLTTLVACPAANVDSNNALETDLNDQTHLAQWYRKHLSPQHIIMARGASASQATNLSRTAVIMDPRTSSLVIAAYQIDGDGSNGPVGSVQPGVAIWDAEHNQVAEGEQINVPPHGHFNVATSNAGHDAPYVVDVGLADVIVTYGAMSTYHGYGPPADAACLGNFFCMPFKFASAAGKTPQQVLAALASGTEYHLPSVGLSEASSAKIGKITIIGGQEQTTSPYGQPGTQGYVAYRSTGPAAGYFDTTSGPWDFHNSLGTASNGLQTITLAPKDNAYFEFAIRSVESGRTDGVVSVEIQGQKCALTSISTAGASASTIAENFVRYFNTSNDPGCRNLQVSFRAVRPRYDTLEPSPDSTVGVDVKSGDVTQLPPPTGSGTSVYCDGVTISCGSGRSASFKDNAALDLRQDFGEHRHFLFGGVLRLGKFYYEIFDVQQVTYGWYGAGHSSLAGALACFRSTGPDGSNWTWTDCSGRNGFTVGPGIRPKLRLGTGARPREVPGSPYLIGPPSSGYPSSMLGFNYDYSMEAQPQYTRDHGGPRWWPVISSTSAVLDSTRKLWIAYQCFDSFGNASICFLRYNSATGATERIGFVDRPTTGGSLGALGFLKNTNNGLVLGALVGNGPKWGCPQGPCAIEYHLNTSSMVWQKNILHSFGGKNFASAPGVVSESEDGTHLLFESIIGTYNDPTTSLAIYDSYFERGELHE